MFAKLMKLFVMALAAGLFASGTALAANPHFIGTPSATLVGFNVVVNFKEAGLGSNQNIDTMWRVQKPLQLTSVSTAGVTVRRPLTSRMTPGS